MEHDIVTILKKIVDKTGFSIRFYKKDGEYNIRIFENDKKTNDFINFNKERLMFNLNRYARTL